MQTSCPHCQTLFNVDEDLIRALDARARCGQCRTVFNARDQLFAEVSNAGDSPETQQYSQSTPPLQVDARPSRFDFDRVEDIGIAVDEAPGFEDDAAIDEQNTQGFSGAPDAGRESGSEAQVQRDIFGDTGGDWEEPGEDSATDEDAFELLERPKPVVGRRTAGWLIGSLVLLAVGAGQWIFANREMLSATPQIRPLLQQVCGYLDCDLEQLRDVEQIELLRRSVYSHPNIDKALIISLAMVNNANYAQPFPVLAIRMADVRGQFIAQRNFEPENYLDAPGASGLMSPGAPVTVTLEIHDPGSDALTFELDFL